MTVENNGRERKSAVIVAHPGHELMIYHWIERQRPLYCCLTDGSGGRAASRVASTTRLLEGAGAVRGPICGRYSDKQIYRLLLDKQVQMLWPERKLGSPHCASRSPSSVSTLTSPPLCSGM